MRILVIAWLLISTISLYAQNGKIISKEVYSLTEEQFSHIQRKDELRRALKEVTFYRITYLSDGLNVKGYMAVPNGSGPYPCIIYNRGGGGEYSKISDLSFAAFYTGELSNAGYIVVASQYRGNDGGEGKDEYGGEDLNDVMNLFPLLANVEKADTSRIGMYGVSRGGMMIYLALRKTDRLKAAIVHSGPVDMIAGVDFRPDIETWMPNFIENYKENKNLELKNRSATYWADALSKHTPILILQSSTDDRVPSEPIFPFAQKLMKNNVPFRLKFYEGGDHGLREHWGDVLGEMIGFLNKYVRDGEQWPDPYRGIEIIGLLGSALATGWDKSLDFIKDTERDGVWILETELEQGEIKFRANNSWNLNWGGFGFPEGRLFIGGESIPVGKGRYRIELNLNEKSYNFQLLK